MLAPVSLLCKCLNMQQRKWNSKGHYKLGIPFPPAATSPPRTPLSLPNLFSTVEVCLPAASW